jgi:3-deoxy-D-manno-octulosonic-acid transferase
VRRFLDVFRPRCVAILETELWPNFITMARQSGARVFLINGKVSDRSFPRYRLGRRWLAPVLAAIEGFCVQTDEDARRFEQLGVPADRIRTTGNCKFDLAVEPLTAQERLSWRASLGIGPDRPVIVAGSTHPGEEEIILSAFRAVLERFPDACLLLAPRHPERFGEAEERAAATGLAVRLATGSPPSSAPPQVVVLNQMGTLARAYGLGEAAIVAGSFCAIGGHNLLEAAAHALPVIYGPRMHSQREMAQLFAAAGAGTQVEGSRLAETLVRFLADPELRRTEGTKARAVLQANQGSAARAVEAIRDWMGVNLSDPKKG